MNGLFLVCALAVQPVYVGPHDQPPEIQQWIHEYHELQNFIQKIHPGAEVIVQKIDWIPLDPGFERIPFTWRNLAVWIKRRSAIDRIDPFKHSA